MLDRFPDSERPLLLPFGVASSEEEPVLRVVPAATGTGAAVSAALLSFVVDAGVLVAVVVSAGVVATGSDDFWAVFSTGLGEVFLARERDRETRLLVLLPEV